MKIEITDNREEIMAAMEAGVLRALEKCGLTAENYAKLNLTENKSVDTGNLRGSITHRTAAGENAVYIGTNNEYAAYVELGTGKYVPGGRQEAWTYQDAKGNWHITHGQRAKPYLKPAVADHAETYRKIIEDELKNG